VFAMTPAPVCTASPPIEEQPAAQTLVAPAKATFKVKEGAVPADCSPASIQWQVSTDDGSTWTSLSGANFVGATSTTLTINSTTTSESGHQFRAVLTNAHGETDSVAAALTVNEAAGDGTEPPKTGTTGSENPSGSEHLSGTGGSGATSTTNGGSSGTSSPAGTQTGTPAAGEVKGFKTTKSTKPLTPAQKLAKALKACRKLKKSKRVGCEKRAHKLYAPKRKQKKH
jgi:hypothetical protein